MKDIIRNIGKALVALVFTFALALPAFGATTVTKNIATATQTPVLTNAVKVTQFTLTSTSTNAMYAVFFDTLDGKTTNTLAAYVSVSTSSGSITNIYTNYFGATNTNIYTALTRSYTTNEASTNLNPIVATIYCPTNTTTVVDVDYRFYRGILITNTAPGVISITYE